MEEIELIKQTQTGDIRSFEKLVKPYEAGIYNFLIKMCHTPETAEDILQETLISAYQKIQGFRGESKFSSWLFRIATNYCLMHKRKNSREINISSTDNDPENIAWEIPDWSNNPAEQYSEKEFQEILDNALGQLPEIYRSMFLLKDVEGFKSEEIAKMLDISLPNVKARTLRARAMLQKILKEKLAYGK